MGDFEIIYETKGKAQEYAPLGVELYQKRNGKIEQVEDALKRLEKDAALLKQGKDQREILSCFKIDPYPTEMELELITRQAIIILKKYDLKFAILTNNGFHAKRDFEILEGYEKVRFGSNLNFKLQDESDKIESDSGNMEFWFNAILEAKKRGIKTWVDIVPENDSLLSHELMNKLFPLVDQWKIALPKTKAQFVPWINLTRKIIKGELEDRDIRSFDDKFLSAPALKENYEGSSNILLIAPHGFPGDDDYTDYLTYFLSKELNASFLINHNKFRKPGNRRSFGVEADLNKPEDEAKNKHIKGFIDKLITAISKVRANSNADPLVIIIHGMSDGTADENNLDFCIGAGYKNSEREKAFGKKGKATASEAIVDRLLTGFRAVKYKAKDGIAGYTGEKTLPGYLKKNKEKETGQINIVQIEMRYTGLREPNQIISSAKLVGDVFKNRAEKITFWPAPAKSSEIKEIMIGEMDLSDGKFKSRIEGYGINKEKLNELIWSIKANGILNNIIVRKMEGKDQYQLISGFRRLSALKKICEERNEDFSNAKISAKVFTKLSDEEAYNISFAENLAREDLSLWEIANSCKAISDDLQKAGESKSNIENHLMKLMQKGQRTVRRYLRISAIKNEEIRKDIHNGNLDVTVAELFIKKEFKEEDRVAVHQFYRKQPMSSRQFEQFVSNLLVLRNWADLKTEKILSFPGAAIFLKIDPEQLKNNVKYLTKQTGNPVDHILEHNVGFLKDSLPGIEAKFAKKPFLKKFSKRSKALESKIGKVFDTQKVGANLSIKPAGTAEDEVIKITISAPVSNIQKAIKLMDKEIGKDFAELKDLWKKPPTGKGTKKKSVKSKFKNWGKVKFKAEDGLIKEAVAPVIISASRATDLPAFYSDWFMERLRKGYLVKRFPRNPKKTEHISFSNTQLIVFWTKNPEPMFQYFDEIDQMEIGYYFQYTLNDYEGDNLEPNVPPLKERIGYFKTLSKRIGKEKLIWRFDPLILTDAITKEKLAEKVRGIMTQLSGFTEKLVISFLKADNHKKVVRNLNKVGIKYRDFSKDDIDFLASYLAKMGKEFGVEVAACAEEFDLTSYGIAPNKCIDDDLIRRVFSHDAALMEFVGDGQGIMDIGQRKRCRCIVSKDIGEYHTCKHLCIYCYANVSEKIVNRNVNMITQTGEMLLPKKRSKYQDWVYETVACCNGCSNDCIYCFAKGDAVNKKRMKLDEWKEGKVRPHDVVKEHNLYDDPVMFPGTHDFTIDNFDACFTVLKKLLAANNRLLIVSKPRLDLITKLCDSLKEYKKNILFRFTIGATNNEILSFWDQYAPLYEERKQSLEYAFNAGYRTSVSIEPMLDSEHTEELVNELSPCVNHSIWIGTMNKTWYFDTDEGAAKSDAGILRARQNTEYYGEAKAKKIREATEKILEGQSKENLKKIYGKLKDNPLVKWKWHIKEAVGLPQPDKPEEWPADRVLGELYAKFRSEKSFFGYNPSVLKSAIQKYARRAEVEKGLWCLVEMDIFSLLEWDGSALDAYLRKYPEETRTNTQKNAQRIRTNMVNRLVVMMSEEVNISAWWMPSKIFDLYQKWIDNRGNVSSQKFLLDMYFYLTSQKMIRLISDLKSVYLIPPDYVKPEQMNDLRQMHNNIMKLYPRIYSGQTEVGEVKWEVDMGKYPTKLKPCIKGIIYNLEKGSDHVFYWIRKLLDLEQEDKVPNYKYLRIVWDVLQRFIDRNSEYEFVRETICALQEFYKRMTHREKPIYLYHAVLLMVRRKEIDWTSKAPTVDIPADEVEKLYRDRRCGGKMEMDDYVLDLHTKKGKRDDHSLEKFALEGAYIKNQNDKFLHQEYRDIYISLKKELDLYKSKGKKLQHDPSDLKMIASEVGVPIQELSAENMTKLNSAPQAQKRTAGYKKTVYIVEDLVFKGPYTCDDLPLMKNLRYTYALQLLEAALQLPEWQRGSLRWEYLGCRSDNQYFLAAPNVGKWKNIPFELVSTKIETNVKVVLKGKVIRRVSDIENNGLLTDKIKSATLQHLYLRFLLDIGDSGTHNVLIREDHESTGRLIAGVDLEETRAIKEKKRRLDHLFKKSPSKKQIGLYESDVCKIKSLSYSQLDQHTSDRMSAVGIDLKRLKENMELWEKLN